MSDFLECKAALSVNDAGAIEGIAWPFGSPDRVGDVIEKGAFTGATVPLPMLAFHDQRDTVGVWSEIREEADGLHVKGKLLIDDVSRAREVRALVQSGAVTGLSIGFTTKNATGRPNGGRTITGLDLIEVSLVAVPAHPGARITTAKAADAAPSPEGNDMTESSAPAVDIEAKFAALETELKGLGALNTRLDGIEAKLNRPTFGTADEEPADVHEAKAFWATMRKGEARVSEIERKALTVADSATAGYLAPTDFASEIIKLLKEYSPIRQYARVVQVGSAETKYPRRIGSPSAVWTDEGADRTASEPSYEQIGLKPYELATYTDVTNQLLEDAAFDIEAELRQEFAEAFAAAEGSAFVNGDGVGKPTGLLTNADIAEVTSGAAAGFPATNPADFLIGAYHALPTMHAQRGVWLMNRTTLGTIRQFKNASGDYIVTGPVAEGMPSTLLGRPIVEAVDMPDVAADATPIIFGDLSGYRIIDRIGLEVLRDPFTQAAKSIVRFHARRRVGADTTNPDRFLKLTIAA